MLLKNAGAAPFLSSGQRGHHGRTSRRRQYEGPAAALPQPPPPGVPGARREGGLVYRSSPFFAAADTTYKVQHRNTRATAIPNAQLSWLSQPCSLSMVLDISPPSISGCANNIPTTRFSNTLGLPFRVLVPQLAREDYGHPWAMANQTMALVSRGRGTDCHG